MSDSFWAARPDHINGNGSTDVHGLFVAMNSAMQMARINRHRRPRAL